MGCSGMKQSWPSCGCLASLGLGASQIHSHAGFYQEGWEVLLILAVSESELAELPRLWLQCWTSATRADSPGLAVCIVPGAGYLRWWPASGLRQHSFAEPHRPKSGKLCPFNLHTQHGVAEDRSPRWVTAHQDFCAWGGSLEAAEWHDCSKKPQPAPVFPEWVIVTGTVS